MSREILQIKNLKFQLGTKTLFENIHFSLNEGDRITLTGASGTGKSTLLKLISLLEIPDYGDILFHGKSIYEGTPFEYRRDVSYCFQAPHLFGQTVKENFQFPYEIRGEKYAEEMVIHYLKIFRLDEDTIQKEVTVLSGGERQRVGLIRNLLFLPKILLLDEVTSNLDQENKEIVLAALDYITRMHHIASISITHDLEEIKNAGDQLYIMENKSIYRKL